MEFTDNSIFMNFKNLCDKMLKTKPIPTPGLQEAQLILLGLLLIPGSEWSLECRHGRGQEEEPDGWMAAQPEQGWWEGRMREAGREEDGGGESEDGPDTLPVVAHCSLLYPSESLLPMHQSCPLLLLRTLGHFSKEGSLGFPVA